MKTKSVIRSPRKRSRLDCNCESERIKLANGDLHCYSIVFTSDFFPLGCVCCIDPSDFKREIHQWRRTGKVSLPNDPRLGLLRSNKLSISVRKELIINIIDGLMDDYLLCRSVEYSSFADFLKAEGIEL